ncbi:MAG: AAA family ATPase [Candidatus Aenigmarchaeota archaeon]|nr:AAA family ATPase [Candidatus Aenigmarchaeota archaeon]
MGMKIICLVGMPGAGKGEVNKVLESEDIPVVVMSSVVRDEVKNRGLELNIKNLDNVAVDLREKFGKDVVARRIAKKVKEIKSGLVCVDGIRNIEEIGILKTVGDVVIVSVSAPKKTRFGRLTKRGESRDPKNEEEFKWRERKQVDFGMAEVIEMADYEIVNDASLERLKNKVKEMLAYVGHV